ncbi:MAG: glycosyltransferase [Acholeplasmataceae bacterium]|nr:glycosyltransferase [Acholeplasmataceae bacterium]
MKLTFFSNFLNHHQIPICNEFYKMLGDDFKFVSCENVPSERVSLGYSVDFSMYPYLIESHLSETNYQYALELGLDSDVVIIGSSKEIFIAKRIQANKLTFRYSERLMKKGIMYLFHPLALLKRLQLDTKLRKKNVWMLSSSAYTPLDYSFYLSYPKKFLKWGYFPEFFEYEKDYLKTQKSNKKMQFLWVGRLIDWKRPIQAIHVIEHLVQRGYDCHLNLIGSGPMADELKTYIESRQLKKYIDLLGSIPADKVRSYMLNAHIFLFTSNREEGWGAVLNEAMNSACLSFAYYRIGSAPYLITTFKNGVIYNNEKDLIKKVMYFMDHQELIFPIGFNAYQTICTMWNHKIASQRFIETSNLLLNNQLPHFNEGPLSIANIITETKTKKNIRNGDV